MVNEAGARKAFPRVLGTRVQMIRIGALAVENLQAMERNRGSSIICVLDTALPGAVVLELLSGGLRGASERAHWVK